MKQLGCLETSGVNTAVTQRQIAPESKFGTALRCWVSSCIIFYILRN